jgi:menaquinone-dependent protoporphyrinogen oxidase
MKGWRFPETLQPTADRIVPRDIALFHGEIDIEKLNLPEKLIVKALKAPADDSRDWDEITAWAEEIAATLQQGEA